MADTSIDPTEDMFAGLKKKKTKKVVNFDEDLTLDSSSTKPITNDDAIAAVAELAAASGGKKADALGNDAPQEETVDETDMFADLKKKKKKKRDIPMDLDAPSPSGTLTPTAYADGTSTPTVDAAAATATTADLGDFGDLKKKKKSSKKKAAFDLEAFEKEIGATENHDEAAPVGDDVEVVEGDLGDDVFTGAGGAAGAAGAEGVVGDGLPPWHGSDRDYTYPELLSRFYHLLHDNNPELMGDRRKLTLVPPSVAREGTKKTVFANLADICKRMHRQPKHVMEFLFAELGTSGSVDGNQRLIIKGRYTQKSMENVLRRYIVEYVVCKTCKSPDTLLTKDNRLYFVHCQACGSRRSVTAIKTGFQAQIGKRSKTKPE